MEEACSVKEVWILEEGKTVVVSEVGHQSCGKTEERVQRVQDLKGDLPEKTVP